MILKIIEGPNINTEYILKFDEVRKAPYSIGRKTNNDISMPDDHHMSNIHARIYFLDN